MPRKYEKNVKIGPAPKTFNLQLPEEQKKAYDSYQENDITFLIGVAGTGKALTLNATLYTRNGPIKMRDIKIGDEIANPDGSFSKVLGVYPQGKKKVFRVHFKNKTYVDCCEEHLWNISQSNRQHGKNNIVNTKYIKENCRRKDDGRRVISISCTNPVNFDRKEFLISPYLLGILISEGGLTSSCVSFSSVEKEIFEKIPSFIDQEYTCKSNLGIPKNHRIVRKKRSNKPNIYKEELKKLNLWGKYSYEKHIPQEYLFGSIDQRIALLQALMDGDGYIDDRSIISYTTTSKKLARDFCQLIYSLGGTTRITSKKGSKKEEGGRYRRSFTCYLNLPNDIEIFLLERKAKRRKARTKYLPKLYIDRVEELSYEEEMQCIAVDHKDKLFLTDNFIPTHNTVLAIALAVQDILSKTRDKIIITRPVVEAGENLGFLPGDMDEKIYPYMLPLYDSLEKICGRGSTARKIIDESYEVAPLAFMRGRSQSLDAIVMTPTGPKTMGSLVIGSEVLDGHGKPTKVINIYPQGKKQVYKVSFSDGTWTECCEEHLWLTETRSEYRHNKGFSVKSLKQIRESKLIVGHQKNHKIPIAGIAQFESQPVEIDPYLMGILLSEGNFNEKCSIKFTNGDDEIGHSVEKIKNTKYDWKIIGDGKINACKRSIKKYGLLGKKSHNKFVPDCYLFNDEKTRIEILRGLMDGDGTVFKDKKNYRLQYYSTSLQLAEDVIFLVQSLGGNATIRKREYDQDEGHFYKEHFIKHNYPMWVVEINIGINPFKLKRKAKKFIPRKSVRMIADIQPSRVTECQCIKVDAPDHLYLTDNFIVTHNTFDSSVCILDEAQNCSKGQLKLFLTRMGKNSKMIVTGDPSQNDLPYGQSGLMEVVKNLEDVRGIGINYFTEQTIMRHPLISEIVKRIS